MKTQTDKQA